MAHAPMPQLISIHASKIGCNQLSMSTLTEVLQSESVKRLLNRQNVYLQTPLTEGSVASDLASSRNSLHDKKNGSLDNDRMEKIPELSVIPIMSFGEKGEQSLQFDIDDKHLLPSKNDGKSSVALLPLKREMKTCGHSEHCESIICNVEFQQFVNKNDIIPLIAINIESSEIDAPVSKHCDNEKCDSLSIEHDRCRRAVVRCHRCDQTNTCDICHVVLKTRKSQMMHKNCKMRIEYRHNKTSRAQLMRDRMRERELQILEATRLNKNDYTDPTTGHERAIESLQKNSELIVIPTVLPAIQHHPTIRITSVTGSANTPNNVRTSEMLRKLMPRFPLILPGRKILLGKRSSLESTDNSSPGGKQMNLGNLTSPRTFVQPNQFISIGRRGNFAHPINVNDYLQSQSQTSSTSQIKPTSYLMPIRVVPIAGLKTEPSLLHHTQGVPKFCLVSQTPGHSAIFSKAPAPISPAQQTNRVIDIKPESVINRNPRKPESSGEFVLKRFKPGMRRGRRKKNVPKRGSKSFECTFCFKRFSTDWYFKLHIAKHKGEIKFTCKFCKKPFMHLYNMQKHIVTMHKQEDTSEETLDIEDPVEYFHCSTCKVVFESRKLMESHRCPIICLRCYLRVMDGDLKLHLKTKHKMSEEKAVQEVERQERRRIMREQSFGRRRELDQGQARGAIIKEETKEKVGEREKDSPKRKRSSLISTNELTPVRRLTRRRNHSHGDHPGNVSTNETCQDETTSEFTLSTIAPESEPISR